jgi:hypothetical protein
LIEEEKIDFVIAQGENSAGGFGITKKTASEFFQCGVDVITSGNHIWDKSDIFEELDIMNSKILRPNNYPKDKPGTGIFFNNELAVINLIGSVWMGEIDSPFNSIVSIIEELPNVPIFIDLHAEATSEKAAMAWYLDGKITALVGTHTHVVILPSKYQAIAAFSEVASACKSINIGTFGSSSIIETIELKGESISPIQTEPIKLITANSLLKKIPVPGLSFG